MNASPYLFYPQKNELKAFHPKFREEDYLQAKSAQKAIGSLLEQVNYPCIPAQKSYGRGEYFLGIYGDFGLGTRSRQMAKDLLHFRSVQKKSSSIYMSFLAVFQSNAELSEEIFEEKMWKELSYLSSYEDLSPQWDPAFSSDPTNSRFCFSLGGEAFFVVGMHQLSSRLARKLPFPVMVFNLFEQFEELERRGKYESFVKTIRERDRQYQGFINPMVEKYADIWESIQFSGRANSPAWKCPFQLGLKPPHENH